MSFQVTTAFVQQFGSAVMLLAQQTESQLRGCVRVETVTGDRMYIDQIGKTEMEDVQSRHADTPLMETPHSRRRITSIPADWADLIDREDQVRTLIDLKNGYTMAAAAAVGRKWDSRIISAFFATAYTGVDGSTTVSFPAGNQVAVDSWKYGNGSGNTGLTVSKLIESTGTLRGSTGGKLGDAYIALETKQLNNLLSTTEVTNQDYAAVKALVKGEIDTFMGLNFRLLPDGSLPLDGSGYRRIPVWRKTGMGLGINGELFSRVTEMPTKRYSTQVFVSIDCGAARLEEAQVVEIKCSES